MTRFFRNAGILAIAEVVVRLKSLLVLPFLTRHFGSVDYGAWAQVAVVIAFLGPIVTLATENAAMRYMPGSVDSERRASFIGWLSFLIGMSLLVATITLLLRRPIALIAFGSSSYATLVAISVLALCVAVLYSAGTTWLRVCADARSLTVITIIDALWNLAAVAITLARHGGPEFLVVTVMAGDLALALLMILPPIIKRPRVSPQFGIIGRYLRFSLPLLPAGFAVWGLNVMDRLFLIRYHTLATVGVYSLSYSLGCIAIQLIVNPLWTMFAGEAAALWQDNDGEALQRLFTNSTRLILLIALPAVAGSAILAQSALQILAPRSFHQAASVVPFVMAGYLFAMLSSYYEVLLGLQHRQYLTTTATVIAVVANLALNILLIPEHGAIGAAIATAAAFFAQLSFTFWKANASRILLTDFRFILRVLFACGIMEAVISLLSSSIHLSAPAKLFVIAPVGVVIFAAAAFAIGAISQEDLHVLRRLTRRASR